jgi:hypothetical protein
MSQLFIEARYTPDARELLFLEAERIFRPDGCRTERRARKMLRQIKTWSRQGVSEINEAMYVLLRGRLTLAAHRGQYYDMERLADEILDVLEGLIDLALVQPEVAQSGSITEGRSPGRCRGC